MPASRWSGSPLYSPVWRSLLGAPLADILVSKEYPKFMWRVKVGLAEVKMKCATANGSQDGKTSREVIRFHFNPLRDKIVQ